MSDKTMIAGFLLLNNSGNGMTVESISRKTGVPMASVYKRVHDLRNEGFRIYSNYRKQNGIPTLHYRLAV